jgi:hypothetical protein
MENINLEDGRALFWFIVGIVVFTAILYGKILGFFKKRNKF